ncbi:LysR family transcriptional regulator [Pseudomonadota bacterium]
MMNKTPFEALDLNLIKIFFVIYEELNTHRAAERLNMSQPNVSRSLQKLRDAFQDPIFVKTRHGLTPTDKAHYLAQHLPSTWQELSDIINHVDEFDLSQLSGKIHATFHPALVGMLSDKLFLKLHEVAPKLQLIVSVWGNETEADLITGKQDFAVTMLPHGMSKEMSIKPLPSLVAKVYLSKSHPLAQSTITEQSLVQYPLAILHVPGWNEHMTNIEKILAKKGLVPDIVYRSPHPSSVLSVVSQTELIHPMGASYHGLYNDSVIRKIPLLDGEPILFENHFCHHYRHRNKPLYQWLFETINEFMLDEKSSEKRE